MTTLVTNLNPDIVRRYTDSPRQFAGKVDPAIVDQAPVVDPNIPAGDLNLGFTQRGGWQVPESAPDRQALWAWEFPAADPTVAVVTPFLGGESVQVPLAARAEFTAEDRRFLQEGQLIVDPIVAALALYKIDLPVVDGRYGSQHFDEAASNAVMEHILSGGSAHADNLGIEDLPELRRFCGAAVAMDTASRTPEKMLPGLVRDMMTFYGTSYPDATLWIGTGTENIDPGVRSRADFLQSLRSGILPVDQYIAARQEQIELVLGHRKVPILFPDALQAALSEPENVELLRRLLGIRSGEIVLHKLGTPFNALTDWVTLDVLAQTADLAYAVKSSDPRFPMQLDDYRAVRRAADRAGRAVVMYTGDDRGWPFDWELGARIQAQHVQQGNDAATYQRNGFTFVRDRNISALLGYIGLNTRQTIIAIIRLSAWYQEISRPLPDAAKAQRLLHSYWDIMGPAMALGTDCFFGPNDPTRAYTHKVKMANHLTGVLPADLKSSVLPHRDSHWASQPEAEAVVNSRLLVLMRAAGAITTEELPKVAANNRARLNLR